MILRKPYAFFIKMFKPMHFIMSIMLGFMILMTAKILDFLSKYIYSDVNVVGQTIKDEYINNLLFIIPMLLFTLFLIILGVMFKKKKTFTLYVVSVFSMIIIIIIDLYTSNFLYTMEKSIVSIKAVKLIHDLVLINIIIESVLFIAYVIRGMGINFKKFNFDSEISKFNISESDKEEFELDINFDLSESKRERRKKLRYLKYAYAENKFVLNLVGIILIIMIGCISYLTIKGNNKINKEGIIYNIDGINLSVNETFILNQNYAGFELTSNNLIAVSLKLKSSFENTTLSLNDFNLKIDEAIFKPTLKYSNDLIDLGAPYKENVLSNNYSNYLIVYEIPKKYESNNIIFNYNGTASSIYIKTSPKKIKSELIEEKKQIKDELNFNEILGEIKFKVNDYEIKDKYLINYSYCINQNECVDSIEYLKPTINQNFDKYILRLNVNYTNNSNLKLDTFYKFFDNFCVINYKANNEWYTQNNNYEEIKSLKQSQGENVYIAVNSNIANATDIKLVFTIRNAKYEYILKQVSNENN